MPFPDIDLIAHAICGMDTEGILALKDAEREEKDGFFSPEYYADRDFPPAFVVGSAKDSLLGESTAFTKNSDPRERTPNFISARA